MEDDRPKTLIDHWDTRAAIALALTFSMITLTFVLALRGPETDAFKVLLGAMLTVGFGSAIGWYFNSSAGSDKKDAVQAKVAEKLADKVAGTGSSSIAEMKEIAKEAAEVAAPPAAEAAAPPVVNEVVPPAVEKAVTAAFEKERDK